VSTRSLGQPPGCSPPSREAVDARPFIARSRRGESRETSGMRRPADSFGDARSDVTDRRETIGDRSNDGD
jgi:hypothetical protein